MYLSCFFLTSHVLPLHYSAMFDVQIDSKTKVVRLGKTYFDTLLNFMYRCHGVSVKMSFITKLKSLEEESHLPVVYSNKILLFV